MNQLVLLQSPKRDERLSNSGARRVKVNKYFVSFCHSGKWMSFWRDDLMYLRVVYPKCKSILLKPLQASAMATLKYSSLMVKNEISTKTILEAVPHMAILGPS